MLANVNIIMANSISVEPAGIDLIGSSEMESHVFVVSFMDALELQVASESEFVS